MSYRCDGSGICLIEGRHNTYSREFPCSFRCNPMKCTICKKNCPKWIFSLYHDRCMVCSIKFDQIDMIKSF